MQLFIKYSYIKYQTEFLKYMKNMHRANLKKYKIKMLINITVAFMLHHPLNRTKMHTKLI